MGAFGAHLGADVADEDGNGGGEYGGYRDCGDEDDDLLAGSHSMYQSGLGGSSGWYMSCMR